MKKHYPTLIILIALFCLVTFVYAIIKFRYFYHDDEMITLRYARNLLNHKGLTWDPGVKVEGYTNFLHLVFSSLIVRITGDFLLAPRVVNFIFFGLMIFFALYLFNKKFTCTNNRGGGDFISFFFAHRRNLSRHHYLDLWRPGNGNLYIHFIYSIFFFALFSCQYKK